MSQYVPDPMPVEPAMPEAMRFVWDELEKLRIAVRSKADSPVVEPAHGGITLETPTVLASIGIAWQQIVFDTAMLQLDVFVDQDFANNGLRLERVGIFSINVDVVIAHEELNSSREMQFRLLLDGTPIGSEYLAFTGRNVGGTVSSFGSLVEVPLAAVGTLLTLEVGSALDSYTIPVLEDAAFYAFSVSTKFEL